MREEKQTLNSQRSTPNVQLKCVMGTHHGEGPRPFTPLHPILIPPSLLITAYPRRPGLKLDIERWTLGVGRLLHFFL